MHIHTKYEDTGPEDKNYCAPDEVVFYKNQLFYFAVKGQGQNDLILIHKYVDMPLNIQNLKALNRAY
jgi:hypothetical protein